MPEQRLERTRASLPAGYQFGFSSTLPVMTIEDLELGVRAYNALKNLGLGTVQEVLRLSVADLLKLRNCGRVTVQDVQEALCAHGLSLRGFPKRWETAAMRRSRI